MSQAGKVLHLYVEVRSVGEDEAKVSGRREDGTGHLMLQCPDVLPHSQRTSTHSSPSHSPDLSPLMQHHMGGGSHSLSPSKSSSRHSVSFQLQSPEFQRQDVLYDSFGQFLEVLAPGTNGPLGRPPSTELDPYQARINTSSPMRLTVPSTPTSSRRSYEVPQVAGEEGRTSVVSFGYIEKSNVHSMAAHRSCQNEPDGPLPPALLRKRLSDPVWYHGQPLPRHLYHGQSPQGSPYLHRAPLDSAGRDAAHRAIEEFGSPELRRRFPGYAPEYCSPTLPRQSPRCRSWGGSPVLPRNTLTLPSKTQLLELDRGVCRGSVNGLPRSPASDHLCAHTGYSSHMALPPAPHPHGFTHSQQRPWMGDESPRSPNKFHAPLPAGRPTDIQHEVPASMFPSSNASRTGCHTGTPHHTVNSSYGPNISNSRLYPAASNPNGPGLSPITGRRSISPNAEVASKLATEATKLSSIFADRRTPSPTPSKGESLRPVSPSHGGPFLKESHAALQGQSSPEPLQADAQNLGWKTDKLVPQTKPGRSHKALPSAASPALPARLHRSAASQSPVLDPRHKHSSSPTRDVSSLHRYQPPQYTGDKSPGVERKQSDRLFDRSPRDNPDLHKKPAPSQNTAASSVSWSSREERRNAGPVQDGCELYEDSCTRSPSRVYIPSKECLGLSKDEREEVQDHSGAAGTSSQSSSGVTGSLGDSSQLDRIDSLSPETSSQSSHDTADGGSGMQVGRTGG